MDKATTSSIDTISRTCIAVRLRLLNRVVTNFYDDALRPLRLKVSQLNVLIVTARLGLARIRISSGKNHEFPLDKPNSCIYNQSEET
jgi:hypothetical protein